MVPAETRGDVIEGPRPSDTGRLRFRAASSADAGWLAEAWSDCDYAEMVGGDRPQTVVEVERLLQDRRARGELDFVFELAESGTRVGRCSLQKLDPAAGSAEIEVEIPESHRRGLGLGREALTALIELAWEELGLIRLEARIRATNRPSLELGRGLGFRLERRHLPVRDQPAVVALVLSKDQWDVNSCSSTRLPSGS